MWSSREDDQDQSTDFQEHDASLIPSNDVVLTKDNGSKEDTTLQDR